MDARDRTAKLCDCLRRYLDANPDAADSLSGIRQWWLPAHLRAVALDDLQQALARLVAGGEVERITLPDATGLYARRTSRSKT